MAQEQVISEAPISIYDLKKELEKIKKRDKELNYRANKTEEYIAQFAKMKNADGLNQSLAKLNVPRLREQHIKKIVDIAPTTLNDLKVVLQGYPISVNNDSMKKIVETVKKFVEE